MKEFTHLFLRTNQYILISIACGILLGYLYWDNYGILWGGYPLSSECWVNCVYGGLIGGLIGSIFRKK